MKKKSKFKVGDRVLIVSESITGVVKDIFKGFPPYCYYSIILDDGNQCGVSEINLELAIQESKSEEE